MTKEELIEVYKEVKSDLSMGIYEYQGELFPIDPRGPEAVKSESKRLRTSGLLKEDDRMYENFEKTYIYAENIDFIEKALEMTSREPYTAVLNPASATRAGGGVRNGSKALEETICRRSNLLIGLEKFAKESGEYNPPLSQLELIWTPLVSIYRDSSYKTMPKPKTINVITAAALNHPSLNLDFTFQKNQEDLMKKKIRMVLRQAIQIGIVSLVLPAWGCGAFKCPAKEVARCFDEVFKEPEFTGAFMEICFAILDDRNATHEFNPEGNFKPFLDRFGKKPLSLK